MLWELELLSGNSKGHICSVIWISGRNLNNLGGYMTEHNMKNVLEFACLHKISLKITI